MVKCEDCKKEKDRAKSCTFNYIALNGGELYKRIPYYTDVEGRCKICGIKRLNGAIHHFGCGVERCPRCYSQLISCDCERKETIKI